MSQLLTSARRRTPSRAPRSLPVPNVRAAATKFNGLYMRPNQPSTGIVPASPTFSESPDIWTAGTNPVADFETALATTQSYAQTSPSNIATGMDNYIYLRAANGAATPQERTAQLYYAPSAVIQWPGEWVNNVIKTDNDDVQANISAVAAGAVGVADQPFLWRRVAPPPSGSHYCLIAQLNDAMNSNPLPEIHTQLDMAGLVRNNLGFGWRNITVVSAAQPTFSYQANLSIPDTMPDTQQYRVFSTPVGYKGWSLAFQCSRTDSKGKPIQLQKTRITEDEVLLGLPVTLDPGFSGMMTVYMYQDGAPAAKPGATVPLETTYYAPTALEAAKAVQLGLVDWRLMEQLRRLPAGDPNHLNADGSPRIGPKAELFLGAYGSLAK